MTEQTKKHWITRAMGAAPLFFMDNLPIIFGVVGGLTLALLVRR